MCDGAAAECLFNGGWGTDRRHEKNECGRHGERKRTTEEREKIRVFSSRLSGLEASVPKHSQMKPIYTKQVGARMMLARTALIFFHSKEHEELYTSKEHQRNS